MGARPGKRSLLTRDEPALWYAAADALPPLLENGAGGPPADESLVEAKRAEAEAAMERESELFEADMGRKSGQDARWLQTVRRSGTTADKVAAHSLVIQVRPPAALSRLCTGAAVPLAHVRGSTRLVSIVSIAPTCRFRDGVSDEYHRSVWIFCERDKVQT